MGLIKKPLEYSKISEYIDYFSPTAGKLKRGKGINPNVFRKYFKILYIETYDHLGKISEKKLFSFLKRYEGFLRRRYPLDGAKFRVILERS